MTPEEICEWCNEPIENGKGHGAGQCFTCDVCQGEGCDNCDTEVKRAQEDWIED